MRYKAKEKVFKQGTPASHLIYIKSGLLKSHFIESNDKEIIIDLFYDNMFLGMHSIYTGGVHQYSATVIQDAELCFIESSAFRDVVINNGGFAAEMMAATCSDSMHVFHRLRSMIRKQLPGRFAEAILIFSDEIFMSDQFTLPLSRNELAEFLGSTRESVTRTMTEFRNDKIIELNGKDVRILTKELLKTISELG
ncbi:MAG: Crp/Fnr family transcriptional regulator [Bacteroidetes bacterium]|nr:Crp/Fnr family transcriptional regulator [Bacteroidota bacterium]MBU1719190.1 Crp/Fnr family transcriptional regulator [Bacteroidota bacterium]